MSLPPIKKILVVSLDNLGDVVMGTSVFRALRQAFPSVTLGYWVKKYTAGLFDDHSMVDIVHASDPFWDTAPGHPKGSRAEFFSTMHGVRKERYDAAVILNTEWRRTMACWWMRIPIRVGYGQRKSQLFLTQSYLRNRSLHVVEENLSLIKEWTGTSIHPELVLPRVEVSAQEKQWAEEWLSRHHWTNSPLVVCHPFAGDEVKCWPLPEWISLVRELSKREPRLRFAFVCGETEGPELEAQFQGLQQASVTTLVGSSLSKVKALIDRASIFVGGDSGPGHVAAALGRPVVSLFGPTNPQRYGPRGHAPVTILQATPLAELEVEKVISAVLNSLGSVV